MALRLLAGLMAIALAASCGGDDKDGEAETTTAPPQSTDGGRADLEITTVAQGLETVWALAWDPDGELWLTERPGLLRRVGGEVIEVDGVVEQGEGGLMGLEIDDEGRMTVMYTGSDENRIARIDREGRQEVLVDGIPAGSIHDGGRLRLLPDGRLLATTGETGDPSLAEDADGLAGKILVVDDGGASVFSRGHRNVQGLCWDAERERLVVTEHGPDEGDEIDVVRQGDDGGWPESVGNGDLRNYTPTIAPAGCTLYDAELIPQWRGSLLFVTLKDESLRRLELDDSGRVTDEEVLYRGCFGRLRDVRVGPDGAVYLATSNLDGRGEPREGDDRVLRIAPQGE
jgi:glucose/arabinose dehydrogenase